MASYRALLPLIKTACPFLRSTQAVNLAGLVAALVTRQTLCLTALARVFPRAGEWRRASAKHELLHRLKRLSRFLSNERVDPVAVQLACLPVVLARLGRPRQLGLLIDWTSFDATLLGLTGGGRRPYQILTIAVPRRGRAVPLLSVVYERDKLPARGSQNRWEQEALAQLFAALPRAVQPIVIGVAASGAPPRQQAPGRGRAVVFGDQPPHPGASGGLVPPTHVAGGDLQGLPERLRPE